jgi:hypothetical protein
MVIFRLRSTTCIGSEEIRMSADQPVSNPTTVDICMGQCPRVAGMKRVMVKAAIPLEVIQASGWTKNFTPELTQAIDEALAEIREALNV